jgi:hypothetical protein
MLFTARREGMNNYITFSYQLVGFLEGFWKKLFRAKNVAHPMRIVGGVCFPVRPLADSLDQNAFN